MSFDNLGLGPNILNAINTSSLSENHWKLNIINDRLDISKSPDIEEVNINSDSKKILASPYVNPTCGEFYCR